TEIGLNWHISNKHGAEMIWHTGGTGGYRTFIGFVKAKRCGVVVLSNSENAPDDIGMHLLDPQLPLAIMRKTVSVDAKTLDRYVGTYELKPGVFLTLTRFENKLVGQAIGQAVFPLTPFSETEFAY